MKSHAYECIAQTAEGPDFVDITDDVDAAIARSGIREGHVTVFSADEGCSILVQERESGLLVDIEAAMLRLNPSAHSMSGTLVGARSVVLPAVGGRLHLGVWQRVLLVELGEARERSVSVQIVGE